MIVVETCIVCAGQESDEIPSAGEQEDQRELGDCDEAGAIADILPRPLICRIQFIKAEDQKREGVCEDNCQWA